jgi:hypothetical protein
MAFVIKQGDTSPSLMVNLLDSSRQSADLTGSTVLFHFRRVRGTTVVTTAPAVIVDAGAGQVRYDWRAQDTATAGDYEGEFEVTYADGSIETFPNEGFIEISMPEQIA